MAKCVERVLPYFGLALNVLLCCWELIDMPAPAKRVVTNLCLSLAHSVQQWM